MLCEIDLLSILKQFFLPKILLIQTRTFNGSGLLSWGQPFWKMYIKTKIQQVLHYAYRIQKLIYFFPKFSLLICKSPKKRLSLQWFYKHFIKILRNEFARALNTKSFLSIIFWNYLYDFVLSLFFLFDSKYVIVMFFLQVFKPQSKYIAFDFTSSAIALLKI